MLQRKREIFIILLMFFDFFIFYFFFFHCMKKSIVFCFSLFALFLSFQSFANCPTNHRELLFRHDVSSGALFTNDTEVLAINTGVNPYAVQKYSRLGAVKDYRQS